MNGFGFTSQRGPVQTMSAAHSHADLEINFLTEGSLTYLIGGRIRRIRSGICVEENGFGVVIREWVLFDRLIDPVSSGRVGAALLLGIHADPLLPESQAFENFLNHVAFVDKGDNPHFPLAILNEKGVVLMACPGCLKAAGKTEHDLAEGLRIADKTQFFAFTKGRILTLDN